MNRLIRVLAIALALAFSLTAVCAQQLQRVQSALDALQQSAAALEQNDPAKAVSVLAGMKSTIEALRGSVVEFRDHAGAAAKKREIELLDVIRRQTNAHQVQEAAQAKVNELPHKIKGLEEAHGRIEAKRNELVRKEAEYHEEVAFRQECASRFADGIFWSTRCTSLGWADLTNGRWSHLNSDIQRNRLELGQSESELRSLREQLAGAKGALLQANVDGGGAAFEKYRLRPIEGGLRAMVVNLNDAVVFWDDMLTLVDFRLGSPIGELQTKVKKLVGKTLDTAEAPTFSTYDGRKISKFQDTLTEFARTLDNQSNILLLPENGGPPCPPQPKSVDVSDATLAAGKARGAWSKTTAGDWQNWIGEARCESAAAVYYGTLPNAQECENRCIADSECSLWAYNDLYTGGGGKWANSKHECWGGLNSLAATKAPPKWGGFISGGIR